MTPAAGLCRRARLRRGCGARRQRASSLQIAARLRLGEKNAGQLQDLVGAAQFLDLSFKALMRSRASVLTPWRWPLARLTHSGSVTELQPIFGTIGSTAVHSGGGGSALGTREPCAQRVRAPRGENLVWFAMGSTPSRN